MFEVKVLKPNEQVGVTARVIQLMPTQLYVLPEGDLENKPSFALLLSGLDLEPVVIAQLSLKMLMDALTLDDLTVISNHILKFAHDKVQESIKVKCDA